MRNTTRSTRSTVVKEPQGNGLKAERIQEALAAAHPAKGKRLKAERIQLVFRDLPAWKLQNGARFLARSFDLGTSAEVGRFLQSVGELAVAGEPVPRLAVDGVHVTVGVPVQSGTWIEPEDFALAQAFDKAA
jgi:pterin-4a-carbinolamine dehydratase